MIVVFDVGQSKTVAGIFTDSGDLVISKLFSGRDSLLSEKNGIKSFLDRRNLKHIIVGVAGLSRLHETWKTEFLSIAETAGVPIGSTGFFSDAELFGFQLSPGSLGLSIGTGSVILKKENDGRISLFGGWGYLFGDELSGVWWFRETVRQALCELETNSGNTKVLDWLCRKYEIIPERGVLIKSVYNYERNIQAQIGSESLSMFQASRWMKNSMKTGIQTFFENVPNDFNQVCLQGGLLFSSDWLQSEIIQYVKGINPHVSFETIDTLLPGGFQCWKSL